MPDTFAAVCAALAFVAACLLLGIALRAAAEVVVLIVLGVPWRTAGAG